MSPIAAGAAVYVGDISVDRLYFGPSLVWEPEADDSWTPEELFLGMYSWWDASDSASMTFNGAHVLTWGDQSPVGHNLGRAGGSGPTVVSINGLGALAFIPGQALVTPPAVFGNFTVCAVFKSGPTVGTYERLVDHNYVGGWWLGRTGNTQTWGGGVMDGPPTNYGRFVPLADNQVHQISSMRAGTLHTISGNGGASLLQGTVSAANTGSVRVTVGDDQGDLSPLTGIVAEVLIWSRALPAEDLAKVEGYLAHKWGIQSKLPAAHPYKSAPPGASPPATAPNDTLVLSHTPGSARNDYSGEVGMRLGVGPIDVPFQWIGIRHAGGNAGPYRVNVYEWFSNTVIAFADVDMTGKVAGEWAWAKIEPNKILANGYYAVVLKTTAGNGQLWTNPGATALRPVIVNTYAIYRDSVANAFATGVIDTQFVGVDLGW